MKILAGWILLWARTMFGDVAMSRAERAKRMFEEACELAQACDLAEDECRAIARRTWSRPKDTVRKEVGGLLVTLLALCEINNVDPDEALLAEARRILSKPNEHWRGKHDAKVAAGTTNELSS